MTGIDKIIETIAQDTKAKCGEILAAANEQAEKIKAEAAESAAQTARAAIDEARQKAERSLATAESRIGQSGNRILLQMKNEVIRQVIASALAKLKALPEMEYFDALAHLAALYAQNEPGEMRLSEKDLNRLPADFAGKLGNLSIAPKPADIADGFVLVYGDVEQNCTFDALISARLDDIKDALHAHIFV